MPILHGEGEKESKKTEEQDERKKGECLVRKGVGGGKRGIEEERMGGEKIKEMNQMDKAEVRK